MGSWTPHTSTLFIQFSDMFRGLMNPPRAMGRGGGVKLKKKDKKGSFDEKEKIKIKDYFQLREIKTYLNEFFC